eukprot:4057537-Prymnesium_polylepis.1
MAHSGHLAHTSSAKQTKSRRRSALSAGAPPSRSRSHVAAARNAAVPARSRGNPRTPQPMEGRARLRAPLDAAASIAAA